jgi:hypothetical protein
MAATFEPIPSGSGMSPSTTVPSSDTATALRPSAGRIFIALVWVSSRYVPSAKKLPSKSTEPTTQRPSGDMSLADRASWIFSNVTV